MPGAVRLHKYHGIGNDFIVLDEAAQVTAGIAADRLAVALCDRHLGVGADGLLLVSASTPKMTIYNADGSRPQMCGNGIRCVAVHLSSGTDGLLEIETDAGIRRCDVRLGGPVPLVEVDMGVADMPGEAEIAVGAASWRARRVNMGNPHAVVFEMPSTDSIDAAGVAANSDRQTFPEGVNVEFAEVVGGNRLRVIVYERGVGRTQACGTGACAAAVAAWTSGLVPPGDVDVDLPGGTLRISQREGRIWMLGPAEHVFTGVLDEHWLARLV